MSKHEELAELDFRLQRNTESTEMLHRRLSEIQSEEDLYREDSSSCVNNIDKLLEISHGATFSKVQSEAFSSLETLKQNVEKAFQTEREQIKDGLQALCSEKDALINKKIAIEEEAE